MTTRGKSMRTELERDVSRQASDDKAEQHEGKVLLGLKTPVLVKLHLHP